MEGNPFQTELWSWTQLSNTGHWLLSLPGHPLKSHPILSVVLQRRRETSCPQALISHWFTCRVLRARLPSCSGASVGSHTLMVREAPGRKCTVWTGDWRLLDGAWSKSTQRWWPQQQLNDPKISERVQSGTEKCRIQRGPDSAQWDKSDHCPPPHPLVSCLHWRWDHSRRHLYRDKQGWNSHLNICTTLKYFILCKSLKRIYFFRDLKAWQLNSIAQGITSVISEVHCLGSNPDPLCTSRVHLNNLLSCSKFSFPCLYDERQGRNSKTSKKLSKIII